jgi:RpiB/LacA/LacB family sugar-phosphate isomerase
MRIAIGCDHAGFPHKATVVTALRHDGHEIVDFGTDSTEPVDYPDYARAVGTAVRGGDADAGILICGSGAGVAIAANKLRGVRAALCHDPFTARQAREDDDANVLCVGARVIDAAQAAELARIFLAARFSKAPRHERRLAKVRELEATECGTLPRKATDQTAMPEFVGATATAVADALGRLEHLDAVRRVWGKDASLWTNDPRAQAAIRNRLGWLASPVAAREQIAELSAFAAEIRGDGITDVVLLGMGGSSLAAEVLAATFGAAPGAPTLAVLDTTDAATVRATRARLKLRQTLFLVSSKSGTTTEMLALYRLFREEVNREVEAPGTHFVAITDPGTSLERLARETGFRRTFLNAPDIGGRFSALSYFGLVPGALLGIDLRRLVESAAVMADACGALVPARENAGVRLGATLAGLAETGRDKVTLVLSPPIRAFGGWLEQLLTESTGKDGTGLVVVHEEPPGPPDVYGNDRVFVALTLADDTSADAPLDALARARHPIVRIRLAHPYELGGEFFRWEMATAAAGIVLGINPFDEPTVAQAKEATQAALARHRESGRLPEWPTDTLDDLARVLGESRPGDYVALLAYLTPSPETTAAVQKVRVVIRDRTRLATTVGYGPRYLHSTGQLHKGGPPTPILVVLTADDHEDLPIPGEAYGFSTLKAAQALGDLATLRAAHRRALWLPLGDRPAASLDRIAAALSRLPA